MVVASDGSCDREKNVLVLYTCQHNFVMLFITYFQIECSGSTMFPQVMVVSYTIKNSNPIIQNVEVSV